MCVDGRRVVDKPGYTSTKKVKKERVDKSSNTLILMFHLIRYLWAVSRQRLHVFISSYVEGEVRDMASSPIQVT